MRGYGTSLEVTLKRVDKNTYVNSDGCWIWTGACIPGEYGIFSFGGKGSIVHRVLYELLIGPIPKGYDADHLCRVRKCVNPYHLEPVTRSENLKRGFGFGGYQTVKTHCPKGHEYTSENTYRPPGKANRTCRTCHRTRQLARYHKKRAEKK